MTPHEFHARVMMLDSRFPLSVTSYKRSAKRNKRFGGAARSRHLLWLGCDVVLDAQSDKKEFTIEAKRQGLRVVDEGDHLHLQPNG